jgi:hypothetical protein
MKHVAGLPNSVGTRMIVSALLRVQSAGRDATAIEQINMRAVSIVEKYDHPKQSESSTI